ncbi:MAG: amino acid adenylation domain-containing protein [Pyrinomonadaceae bacterium]
MSNREEICLSHGAREVETRRFPLSPAQRRIWFLEQLWPNLCVNNLLAAYTISGILDVGLLAKSIAEIVERHEILRTTFSQEDEQPVQTVQTVWEVPLRLLALETDSTTELEPLISLEEQSPFDLERELPFRVCLINLGEQEQVLVLNIHHIASDGAHSCAIFMQELCALYNSFASGLPTALDKLELQYSDFAGWQLEQSSEKRLAKRIEDYKRTLEGVPVILNPFFSRERPPAQTFEGTSLTFTLDASLTKRLRELSDEEGITLFTTLLAGFQTLLYRYTSQQSFFVGAPAVGRSLPGTEKLIGYFGNPLAIHADFSGQATFREVLQRCAGAVAGAHLYQDIPFDTLVSQLQPHRDPSRSPIFQVLFDLQPPWPACEINGFPLRPRDLQTGIVPYDMTLFLSERDDTLVGQLAYNTDLFDDEAVRRVPQHFQRLLEDAAARPELAVATLNLLTDEERRIILDHWNDTAKPQKETLCVHHLFEEQVRREPERIAVAFGDEQLSYRELNRRANQLAHYLMSQGVGPETLVGICLPRSLDAMIGLLAIFKAGGAFVALDTTYPAERLGFMLDDSRAAALLTRRDIAQRFPEHRATLLCLDTDAEAIARHSDENPQSGVTTENLSYIIYTSGSTGKPKGIAMRHACLSNLVAWHAGHPRLSKTRRTLQFAAFNFDISYQEMFTTWLSGDTLVLVPEEIRRDSERLLAHLAAEKIERLYLPFVALEHLASAFMESPLNLSSLKEIVTAGEQMRINSRMIDFASRLAGCAFHNQYGPSECHVVTIYNLPEEAASWPRLPPIGTPLDNLRLYLLNELMEPVPVSVQGEIYIGGAGLSRGYLYRPDLTAEMYVPNPFSNRPGERLYRTGDLGRYLPDGKIEFIGRVDDQAKIRGYRVEPGEIAAVLNEHPAVDDALVMALPSSDGHHRLVAYVVPQQRLGIDVDDETTQIERWQTVWDEVYGESGGEPVAGLNLAGWKSSYTGLPIAEDEMREWVETTVERILSLRPREILEVGCGTGLLLLRLAPHCARYLGMDISEAGLQYTKEQLEDGGDMYRHVNLQLGAAADIEKLAGESYDTIIINSVIQQFPSLRYLRNVIDEAVKLVKPGGRLFLGDIQNLALMEMLRRSIETHKAGSPVSLEEIEKRVRAEMAADEQLYIAPEFFYALQDELPNIMHVEIQLRRGHHHNEMNKFRYDAILTVGGPGVDAPAQEHWVDWPSCHLTTEEIRELLAHAPDKLCLKDVANARLREERKAAKLPQNHRSLQMEQAQDDEPGLDPEDLWRLADRAGYRCSIYWSEKYEEGAFDAVLMRDGGRAPFYTRQRAVAQSRLSQEERAKAYANHPLHAQVMRRLIPELRSYLERKLPEYMVPALFVILESLPLKPTGKVDRESLALIVPQTERRATFVAPRNPIETKVAEIWSGVLGMERIAATDNFFQLGGHSLLATQVMWKIRESFSINLPLATLFRLPTVEGFAGHLESVLWAAGADAPASGSESLAGRETGEL